jgi:hypothetical protein
VILFALLVIALVCIIVGVITAAGPWFIGSLVASALAGIILWQRRSHHPGAKSSGTPPTAGADTPSDATTDASADSLATEDVWVVDGRPRYHLSGCATIAGQRAEQIPLAQAKQDGFIPCSLCAPSAAVT